MNKTRLILIAILALTATLTGIMVSSAFGQTTLFSHTFPRAPHGI